MICHRGSFGGAAVEGVGIRATPLAPALRSANAGNGRGIGCLQRPSL